MWLPYISQSSKIHSSKREKAKSEPLKVLPVNLHFVKNCPLKIKTYQDSMQLDLPPLLETCALPDVSTSFLLISDISSFNVDRL